MSKNKNKEKDFYIILGQVIKKIRKENEYSLEEFSKVTELGLDKSTIYGIENGRQRLSFYQLCLISKSMGIPVSKIIVDIEYAIEDYEQKKKTELSEKDKLKIDNI